MKDKLKKNDPIRKAKRKKAWLVFLRIVLIAIAVIAVFKITDVLVEKTIENAYPSYFEFSNSTDNLQQVTADFKVPLKITSKNGKKHKVKWTENSPYLSIDKEGNVTVKEPEGRNVKVVLWENYGWLIFKGKRQYVLDLVTSNVQQFDSEADIPVDKVINGTYHRDMDIAFDENDNVAYVFGDFGNTKLYNEKDIVAYIEHNRKALNIPDELEIKGNSYSTSKSINTCNLDLYYDGVRIDDNIIVVAVSNEDYKPKKVTCDITRDFSTLNENIEIDLDACKEVLETYYEVSSLNVSEIETVIVENKYCSIVNVEVDNYNPFEICVDKESLEVMYENTSELSSLYNTELNITDLFANTSINVTNEGSKKVDPNQNPTPELEPIMLKGRDEYDKVLKFEGSTDGYYTYMYDLSRKIKVYQCINDGYNTLLDEKDVENSYIERVPEGFAKERVGDTKQLVFSKNEIYDRSFAVEVESLTNIQNIYDKYIENFGWNSFNNKGDEFSVYTNAFILYESYLKPSIALDNAFWGSNVNSFIVGKSQNFALSPIVDPTTAAHEYSHGVYNTITSNYRNTDKDKDIKALNEAFADVMGVCLLEDSTWEVCKIVPSMKYYTDVHPEIAEKDRAWNLCVRDLKTVTGGTRYEICNFATPKYYDDELYNKNKKIDEHDRAVLIGNIAYKMDYSDEFTQKEIAYLWFTALRLGFDDEVTLPRFRTNLIEAIELECQERKNQKIELVEKLFDEKHIYSENIGDRYIGKNKKIINKIISTENNSIEGDPLLDDTYVNSYYMFYSPIAFTKKNPTIFLIESTSADMPKTDKTTKKIGKDIEHYINKDTQLKKDHEELLEAKRELDQVVAALKELLGKDSDAVSNTSEESTIQVVYLRVPKYLMIAIQKANENQGVQVKESILDAFTEDEDSKFWQLIVDFIWRLMFHDEYYESTAYDFYSSL